MLSHIRPMPTKRAYPSAPASPTGALPQTVIIPARALLTRFRGIPCLRRPRIHPVLSIPMWERIGPSQLMELDSIHFRTRRATTYRPFTQRQRMKLPLWRVSFTKYLTFKLPRSCDPKSRRGSISHCRRSEICGWCDSPTHSCASSRCQGAPNRFAKTS
jgi:hypothetical protein